MSDAIRRLDGARDATVAQINEIVRGATIKQITPERAEDHRHGGQILRIELRGGDWLLVTARPRHALDIDGPTASIQLTVITSRKTKLSAF